LAPRSGGNITGMPTDISVEEAQRLLREDDALLLEVLPREEYLEEHIAGADNIPLKELSAEAVRGIDRDRPVVVYCDDDL
jgi:rhodanese-related sulfurtransferase